MTAIWLLVACAWKAALLVGLGALLLRLWPRSSASERHAAWSAVFLALLALPAFSLLWSMAPLPVGDGGARQTFGFAGEHIVVTVFGTENSGNSSEFLRIGAWLAGLVWALGASFALFRLAIGHLRVRRYLRNARTFVPPEGPWQDRIPFPVLLSPLAPMPMAVGLSKPYIVLPAGAPGWEPGQLRRVLLHEAAHLRRNDVLWKLIASVAGALYWFHPVVQFALRMFSAEREQACDDAVLATGALPSHYAADLLAFARNAAPERIPAAILLVSRPQLEARIAAILDGSRPRQNLRSNNMTIYTCILATFVLPLSAFMSAAQSPASGELRAGSPGNPFTIRESVQPARAVSSATAPLIAQAPVTQAAVPVASVTVASRPLTAAPQKEPPGHIRVSGDLQKAKLIKQVNPKYPADAKAEGVSGLVRLKVRIDKEGLVKETTVEESPDKRLTESSVEAVSQWVYAPTLLNGNPVEVLTTVDVNYSLKKQ